MMRRRTRERPFCAVSLMTISKRDSGEPDSFLDAPPAYSLAPGVFFMRPAFGSL